TRTRLPEVVATVGDDLGLGQVCACGDHSAWVGSILTWTEHRVALLAQRFGPELYDKRRLGATRCTRYSINLHHLLLGAVTVAYHHQRLLIALLTPMGSGDHPSLYGLNHQGTFTAIAHVDPLPGFLTKGLT